MLIVLFLPAIKKCLSSNKFGPLETGPIFDKKGGDPRVTWVDSG